MSNDRPLTFKFRFRAPGANTPQLVVVLKDNRSCGKDDFVKMMQEGKMPLPNSWIGLTKTQLADLGYPKVRWSKKYGVRYVDTVRRDQKQYDS